MKIGVTGGNGFIGSWVRKSLAAQGHSVVVFDHRGKGDMLGDVRDSAAVHELAAHVDGIIHLAAVLGTAETINEPRPALETNIYGTINVFEACAHYDLPVVYAAVGNSGIGRGTYCITKTCGEDFVAMYREDRGLRVHAVRPMNAYGPGQSVPQPWGSSKVRKIVPTFVCSALDGVPMQLYGGGLQVSDTVYVADVANAFVQALNLLFDGVVLPHPIDVGNTTPLRVIDVALATLNNIPNASYEIIPMRAGEPVGGPMSTTDALDAAVSALSAAIPSLSTIDIRRVVKRLGTVVGADVDTMRAAGIDPNTFVPLEQGLAETIHWYQQMKGVVWQSQK